jgi:hypothetical protein
MSRFWSVWFIVKACFRRLIFFYISFKFDLNLMEQLNDILQLTSEIPLIKLEPEHTEPNIETQLDEEYNQLKMKYESLLSSFESMETLNSQSLADTVTLAKSEYQRISTQVLHLENEFHKMKVSMDDLYC